MSIRQQIGVPTLIVTFFLVITAACLPGFGASPNYNWDQWRRLPVYESGRAMPLNTYARMVVSEICGSSEPMLYVDDQVLTELNFGVIGPKIQSESDEVRDARIERIVERIRELIPPEGRRFEAHELLFSWMVEPEIWEYIPVVYCKDNNYRTEVLGLQPSLRLRHIASGQLDASERFYEHRLAIVKNKTFAEENNERFEPSEQDAVTLETFKAYSLFKQVVYDPDYDSGPREQYDPELCYDLQVDTYKTYTVAMNSFLGVLEKLSGTLLRIQRATELPEGGVGILMMRMNVFIRLGDLLSGASQQGAAEFDSALSEARFEFLLEHLDTAIKESEAVLDVAFDTPPEHRIDAPEAVRLAAEFNIEKLRRNRNLAFEYNYQLRKMRDHVLTAYRSVYDNGRTLRILPALHEEPIRPDRPKTNVSSPWVSFRTLQRGGNAMLYRFADRIETAPSPAPKPEDIMRARISNDDEHAQDAGRNPAPENGVLALRALIAKLREDYRGGDTAAFVEDIDRFSTLLRDIAQKNESVRESLLPEKLRDGEILRKTAYPVIGAMNVEYRYSRLDPFFQMWVAALCSVLATGIAILFAWLRRRSIANAETIEEEPQQSAAAYGSVASSSLAAEMNSSGKSGRFGTGADFLRSVESFFMLIGILLLVYSAVIAGIGMGMRSYISGWVPISNMFECLILFAFIAALLGIGFTLQPFIGPLFRRCWGLTAFPSLKKGNKSGSKNQPPQSQATGELGEFAEGIAPGSKTKEITDRGMQIAFSVPRILLMLFMFRYVMCLCFAHGGEKIDIFEALNRMFFETKDPIDLLAVIGSVGLFVWLAPRLLLSIIGIPFAFISGKRLFELSGIKPGNLDETAIPATQGPSNFRRSELQARVEAAMESSSGSSGKSASMALEWVKAVSAKVLDRKVFLICCAAIVFIGGVITFYNRQEFNPNIRPIMAVLRSNFWLAIHVTAIIASYAVGFVAWLLALVSLGMNIFGRYDREMGRDGRIVSVEVPKLCNTLAPYILRLLQTATILLAAGTILGGRWADYSWGRFWGWDPKEVWALITLFVYLVTLHGYRARMFGQIGLAVGAICGAIAVVITWYGFNFVFSVGRHAYGGGTGGGRGFYIWLAATLVVILFFWAGAAIIRYRIEKSLVRS